MQVDAFLKEHEIFDYSAADFEQDRETLRELRMREVRPFESNWASSIVLPIKELLPSRHISFSAATSSR
jgi:hypothetical protein